VSHGATPDHSELLDPAQARQVAETMQALATPSRLRILEHFGSRDDLVTEAVDAAIEQGQSDLGRAVDGAADPLAAFLEEYVSEKHRDDPGTDCTVVALGANAARADPRALREILAEVRAEVGDG
jgi:TetR/AcrR family transcriptional repressor of nem operon